MAGQVAGPAQKPSRHDGPHAVRRGPGLEPLPGRQAKEEFPGLWRVYRYVQDHDLFHHKLINSEAFTVGFRSMGLWLDVTANPALWDQLLQVTVTDCIRRGLELLPAQRYFLLKHLAERHVRIMTLATIKEIDGSGLTVEDKNGVQKIDDVDNIILAAGAASVDALGSELKDTVPEMFIIGDARNPGKILQAVHQAVEAVRSLG